MLLKLLFDILWARRMIVLTAVAACCLGGLYVIVVSPPRYDATARVILEFIKPNQITGATVGRREVDAYVTSQIRMLQDYQVAVPAAEALGLLDNPAYQSAFNALQPNGSAEDFAQWVAQHIMTSTTANMVADSNIMEIHHVDYSPEQALVAVDAIRNAYIQSTRTASGASANDAANRLDQLIEAKTIKLAAMQAVKAEMQKKTGIMPGVGENRLADLMSAPPPTVLVKQHTQDVAEAAFVDADLKLSEAAKSLGPNNPRYRELKARRDMLKVQLDQERSAAAANGGVSAQMERVRQAQIEIEKSKLLSERGAMLDIRLVQDQIDRVQRDLDEYRTQAAKFRQLSTVNDVSLTPMGPAESNPTALFPNPLLIMAGTAFLGLALGGLLALLVELLGRRARRTADVEMVLGVPVLGTIPLVRPLSRRQRRPGAFRRPRLKTATA